jgi:DUF4097 and DUF4098 domain-containing protein YvlB
MNSVPVETTGVRISSTNHRVEVTAEDRDDVAVSGKANVSQGEDGITTVDDVRSKLHVRIPSGTDVTVGTTSARVEISGRVGAAAVVTQSGRIELDHARSVDARTDSARVEVDRVDEGCRVRTESGKVEVRSCGAADIATSTGRIELGGVDGDVKSHCVSGKIEIAMVGAHDVDAETVSGRIEVSLPAGVRVHRPAGVTASPAVDAYDCTVNARSVTGRVDVTSR